MSLLRALVLFLGLLPAAAFAEALDDQSSPAATVESWRTAVALGNREAALALGTPAWREEEAKTRDSFTRAIFDEGFKLKEFWPREPEVEGNKATVSAAAIFDDNGRDDREGLNFTLELLDGRWMIVELR